MNDRDARIDAAIAEYLAADAPPDRAAFLARHADLADSLHEFLDDHERMRQAAQPPTPETVQLPANPAFAPTLSPSTITSGPLGTVRYIGDFELLEEIARGAMGVVYKARQVSLNRVVALKMILAGQFASATDVQRFRQEAEAAANIDHPNVLPIYEVGEHEGHQYFAMKLVAGGNLASQVTRLVGRPREAVLLLEAVARGVYFAHQRGIMHRDLKPANVLLDTDGTPFIADFGLAKKSEGSSSLTQSGAIVGTPSYMAPEQARGSKSLTTAVDTYALGAILYELLTGNPPFKGDSVAQTLRMVEDNDPTPPATLKPDCDPELAAVAMKGLEKDPARRYESAAAFADDLQRWLAGEPVTARPTTNTRRAIKWVKRNPAVAALVGALAIVLLLGSFISIAYAVKSRMNYDMAMGNLDAAVESDRQTRLAAENTKDALCRSQFVQARALRLAHEPGWRDEALGLLKQSAEFRQRSRQIGDVAPDLPTLPDLRGEVVNCLLASDATIVRRIPFGIGGAVYFSGDGRRACAISHNEELAINVTITDVATGQQLKRTSFKKELPDDQKPLNPVAINHDGSRLACPHSAAAVRVHDAMTGQLVTTCRDTALEARKVDSQIYEVQFSPDGKRLAVIRNVDRIAQVVVWDLATPDRPRVIYTENPLDTPRKEGVVEPNDEWFHELRFSPDSNQIDFVGLGRRSVKALDLRAETPTLAFELKHKNRIESYEWSPDGRVGFLVTGVTEKLYQITLWDLATKQSYATCAAEYRGRPDAKFSPDGRSIAVVAYDSPIRVFAAADGAETVHIDDSELSETASLTWTPTGELTAFNYMNLIVLRLSFGNEIAKSFRSTGGFGGEAGPMPGMPIETALSPDGRWIAVYRGGRTDEPHVQQVDGPPVPGQPPKKVQEKPEKENDILELIDRQTGRVAKQIVGDVDLAGRLIFSQDSRRIVICHHEEVIVRDVETGAIVFRRPCSDFEAPMFPQPFFGPDGRLLVVTPTKEVQAMLWDVEARKRITILEGIADVSHEQLIAISSCDGTRLLVDPNGFLGKLAGKSRTQQPTYFDIPSGKRLGETGAHVLRDGDLYVPVVFSRDNRHVATFSVSLGKDPSLVFLDKAEWAIRVVPTGEPVLKGEVGFGPSFRSLGPDPSLVLVADDRGNAILWDLDTKEKLVAWQPHRRHRASYFDFSPDGAVMAISDKGETLSLLHIPALRQRLRAMGLDW